MSTKGTREEYVFPAVVVGVSMFICGLIVIIGVLAKMFG